MKRIYLTFIIVIFGISEGFAQPTPEDQDEKSERVEAAKAAFITTRLKLTSQQSQQFWPVFNDFETSKKKIRKQLRQLRIDNMLLDASEDQLKADIKKMFALRQEELDLEKLYAEKFLKVISAKQLAEFYISEKEFTKMLLKRLGGGRKRGDFDGDRGK